MSTFVLALMLAPGRVGASPALPEVLLCLGEAAVPVRAEVAGTPALRDRGLSQRAVLARRRGMLFVMETPDSHVPFYMYRTRMPLDLAFLDDAGRVLGMYTMAPCQAEDPRRCPLFHPPSAYSQALEVNAGLFQRYGLRVGDIIRRAPPGGCADTNN